MGFPRGRSTLYGARDDAPQSVRPNTFDEIRSERRRKGLTIRKIIKLKHYTQPAYRNRIYVQGIFGLWMMWSCMGVADWWREFDTSPLFFCCPGRKRGRFFSIFDKSLPTHLPFLKSFKFLPSPVSGRYYDVAAAARPTILFQLHPSTHDQSVRP